MRHRQQASALLTALFITAIAAIMATAVIYKFRLMVHLATLNTTSSQSYLYLIGVVDQAQTDISHYANAWEQTPLQNTAALTLPQHIGPQKFENTYLEASIDDAQGLYNINNLVSANNQINFINLMRYVLPQVPVEKDLEITEYITNWLAPGNASDALYAHYSPPYRAAHRPMHDISELRLIAGITPDMLTALKPYIVALPQDPQNIGPSSAININTAPLAVLLTLSPQMDIQKAQSLYECRRAHGVFLNTDDYNKTCVAPLGLSTLNHITTHSNFFMVHSSATTGAQQVLLSSLISTEQNTATEKLSPYIVWQTSE